MTRQAVVAGQFYPAQAAKLSEMIRGMVDEKAIFKKFFINIKQPFKLSTLFFNNERFFIQAFVR